MKVVSLNRHSHHLWVAISVAINSLPHPTIIVLMHMACNAGRIRLILKLYHLPNKQIKGHRDTVF